MQSIEPSGKGENPREDDGTSPDQPAEQTSDLSLVSGPETSATAPESELVSVRVSKDGVATLSIGRDDEKIVSFSPERMKAISATLDQLESLIQKDKVHSVVVTSDHPKMFAAGADLTQIDTINNYEKAHTFIRYGQELFGRISKLGVPTVAAIHGTCLGGALELALHCDRRVCTDDRNTQIGFPEVKIGLLPGWGGTTLLPGLIGLRPALNLMLKGESVGAREAKSLGIVDAVTSQANLIKEAERLAKQASATNGKSRKLPVAERFFTHTSLGRRIVAKAVGAGLKRGHAGHYAAPKQILKSALYGLTRPREDALKNEAKLEAKLLMGDQCRSMVHLFFTTEASKGLGKASPIQLADTPAEVTGAGIMGAGITAVLAKSGGSVDILDLKQEQLDSARGTVDRVVNYSKSMSDAEKEAARGRVQYRTQPDEASPKQLYIEGVPEIMELKERVLAGIADRAPQDALIVSNTSSLPITEMAKAVKNPERFAGLHYFNPVERLKLLEIVRGEQTSDETINKLCALAVQHGKLPIVVADVSGFLVNRILGPYMSEGVRLLEEGNSIEAIDRAAKDFGMPMGPMGLLDEVGLDTAIHVAGQLAGAYPDRMELPEAFGHVEETKLLGKKSGKGFYDHPQEKKQRPTPNLELEAALQKGDQKALPQVMEKRMILSLVNEAVRCLDEGVAGNDFPNNAMQIDLGSVMGFGFAPFRGGLIRYANRLGAKKLLKQLEVLETEYGERFRPSEGIRKRAESGKSFYEPAA